MADIDYRICILLVSVLEVPPIYLLHTDKYRCSFILSLASISVSSYSIALPVIQDELHCSRMLALAGITLYTVMFGIAPMVLAPLSEIYGRRNVYIASAIVYTAFQLPQALAPNIATMLVGRALSGVGGSTAISLVVSKS
jgi:MFS family permease